MWYGVIDGEIWFETKAKSQKAVNIRRNPICTVMIEDGLTYNELRGVSIEGTGEILDDPDSILKCGISVWERYNGPYTDEMRPYVDQMMNKRVAVRIKADRVRSWDHRKLGLPEVPLAGTTAEFLGRGESPTFGQRPPHPSDAGAVDVRGAVRSRAVECAAISSMIGSSSSAASICSRHPVNVRCRSSTSASTRRRGLPRRRHVRRHRFDFEIQFGEQLVLRRLLGHRTMLPPLPVCSTLN